MSKNDQHAQSWCWYGFVCRAVWDPYIIYSRSFCGVSLGTGMSCPAGLIKWFELLRAY